MTQGIDLYRIHHHRDDECNKQHDKDNGCGEKHKFRAATAILKIAVDVHTDFDCDTDN